MSRRAPAVAALLAAAIVLATALAPQPPAPERPLEATGHARVAAEVDAPLPVCVRVTLATLAEVFAAARLGCIAAPDAAPEAGAPVPPEATAPGGAAGADAPAADRVPAPGAQDEPAPDAEAPTSEEDDADSEATAAGPAPRRPGRADEGARPSSPREGEEPPCSTLCERAMEAPGGEREGAPVLPQAPPQGLLARLLAALATYLHVAR